jgi:hypothetical protein
MPSDALTKKISSYFAECLCGRASIPHRPDLIRWHGHRALASKHKNCIVLPCMNLINPGIRMLRALTPIPRQSVRLGRTKLMIVP